MLLNLAFLLLCLIPLFKRNNLESAIGSFGLFGTGILLELFIGLILVAGQKTNELGKAILINVGIILVIGFSVCGVIATMG